jgi:predicted DNA-binding transcriptional regulator AlpA
MSKLVKPTEYANELGISRQAVYAKIKKGLLTSKTVDGKIYIILDKELDETFPEQTKISEGREESSSHLIDVKELLNSKEQTISVLKESILDLKQTNTEINTTLRGEIELLKQVFTEMRNLYVKQVDYMGTTKHLEIESREELESVEDILKEEECWITLSEFFNRSHIEKKKKKLKIEKRLRKAYFKKDKRFKMDEGMLYLSCYHFYEDILKK